MKWIIAALILTFFSLFFPLYYVFGQDAQPSSQLLLIPGILNDCETSISNLEANTNASNRIISDLQKTNNFMSTTIETQQRQLDQASESLRQSEAITRQKSQSYEAALQSLETSLTELSRDNKEKDGKILKLTEANSQMKNALFVTGGILLAIAGYLITRFILWIKGGAAVSLIKTITGRQ